MNCPRCGGLMVNEKEHEDFEEVVVNGADEIADFHRCVSCGEVIDTVILRNRALQRLFEEDEGYDAPVQ